MDKVIISSICDIELGKTPARRNSSYWGKGSKWVSISDMKDKYISNTKEEITDKAIKETRIKLVPKNTVIMSFKLSVGKVAITSDDMYTNEAIAAFHIKSPKEVSYEYLYYALQTLRLSQKADRAVMGLTLNKKKLKQLKIPLPSLQIQKKIVKVLDKAQELIDLRKKQIEMLDELIQSIFYDMFGDPVTNPKGWDKKKIKDVTSKVSSGSTPRGGQSVYSNEGYYFIRSQNVLYNSLKLDDVCFIDEEIHNNMKRTWLKNRDILLNITGASIGRVATYNLGDNMGNVNQHVCIIRPTEKINSMFLSRQMSLKNYQRRILIKNAGGTREAFNYTQIKNFKLILPPIELQNEFAQKVQRIEEQKELMQESLTEMQNNFNSLMQKAFKGELFN